MPREHSTFHSLQVLKDSTPTKFYLLISRFSRYNQKPVLCVCASSTSSLGKLIEDCNHE